MKRGWIRLYRKIFDNGLHTNHKAFILWIWLLTHASHKKRHQTVGSMVVDLEPGQVVTGRKKLAQQLNMSEQSIRTAVKFLEKLGCISTNTSTKQFTIITIVNWEVYQGTDDLPNQGSHQRSNQGITKGPPTLNHKQECIENLNKEELRKRVGEFADGVFSIMTCRPEFAELNPEHLAAELHPGKDHTEYATTIECFVRDCANSLKPIYHPIAFLRSYIKKMLQQSDATTSNTPEGYS